MIGEGNGRPRNRLYRNSRRSGGLIFGVCSGFADYFGFDPVVVRVVTIVGAIFSGPLVCIAYVVAGFIVPRKPDDASQDAYVDPVQRQVRSDPHEILSSVRYRARDLDARLARLEKYVTSNRFQLDREFRQLKD